MVLLRVWDVLLRVSDGFVTCLGWFCYVFVMDLLPVLDGFIRVSHGFVTCVGWICYVCGMDLYRV